MNQDYKITVDIYCQWQGKPKDYRIYIDDDLLTERTYIWDNNDQYVQEIIIVNVPPGKHVFKLESVIKWFKGFSYKNFKVNNNNVYIDPETGEFTL